MSSPKIQAIVLAAGKSSRFNTSVSKLLTSMCGRPMITFPLMALKELSIPATLVLGHQADLIKAEVARLGFDTTDWVIQEQQLGTGHALAVTRTKWTADYILVLNGDHPLITSNVLNDLVQEHITAGSAISFLTTHAANPTGYGRVIIANNRIRIVEEKECTPAEKTITLVNAGIYIISRDFLEENINKIQKSSLTGEFYLPELISAASNQGLPVCTPVAPYDTLRGVNTLEELWGVELIKRAELMSALMRKGVRFALAQSTHLDVDVEIGKDSFIGAGAILLRGTKIGAGCSIGAASVIEHSTIGDNTVIHPSTVIQDSTVGSECEVGPFARLRADAVLDNDVVVGNFVEIKNSNLGQGTRVKHLAYLGNAQVGKAVNIGAGTITCNYNGVYHNQTIIEDNASVGTNNSLVAPLRIGKGAYTAAGSTITNDVAADDLAIARARQINKTGYARVIREKYSHQKQATAKAHEEEQLTAAPLEPTINEVTV